jgi:peptide/nickel transport system substrate-binding protein
MKKSKWYGVIPGNVVGAMILSGCTATGTTDDTASAPPYVYAIDDDPRGLNAQFVGAPMTAMFSAQMLEPLIFLSSTYKMSPGLATEWTLSDDGLTLTLKLRKGVTWHDGKPFTAEDVKFNFDEIVPLNSYGAAIGQRLDSVEVADESTVVLHLKKPYGPLLETISSQYMLPKHVYEGTDYVTNPANMAPIGTGPMKFDSYSSGEAITLVKNADYWGGDVKIDRAVFPIMSDATSRTESLFAGEVDQTVVDISALNRIADDPKTTQLGEFGFPQNIALMLNGKSKYLTDPKVRQAVFAAFDRDALVKTALQGQGTPADGFFPQAMKWSVSPNVSFSRDFPHDVAAIEKTLDEAGLPRGADNTRFTLNIRYTSERTDTAAMAEMARSLLAEVGIKLNLEGSSATVFTEKVYSASQFDLALLPATVGADPSIGITRWYMCNPKKMAGRNPSQICDEKIDQFASQALDSSKHEDRAKALTALQDRAADLMFYAPLVWFNGQFPSVNTTRWKGQEQEQPIASRVPWLTMTYAGG